jgi:hypothetical protein
MRKALLLILTVLCILLIVPMAQSQVGTAAIRVVVDHDFSVGSIHLPAEEYKFSFNTETSRVYIKNVTTGESVSVFTRDIIQNPAPAENKLVFQQDGNELMLHQIWSQQAGHVHDIVHGTEVKELQ